MIGLVEDAGCRVCVKRPSRRHISPSVAAPDDVARQDAGESGFDLAHDRTGGAGAGRDTSSFQVQTIDARIDDALRQGETVASLSGMLSVLGILIASHWHLWPDQFHGRATNP